MNPGSHDEAKGLFRIESHTQGTFDITGKAYQTPVKASTLIKGEHFYTPT